ncbi:MAG TPA: THxN family PEP-CTERM protein [Myxococcota bacterium]
MRNALGALLIGLAASLLPASRAAAQAQITFTSAAANWHSPTDDTPGSQPGDPVITNGAPTSSINWGTTSGPQSGYDVTISIVNPQTFPVATFAHRNFPVSPPSLTSVQLDIVLDFLVNGVQTGPLTFTFTFTHEETPNNQTPCPYPTPPGQGCTDRVTFVDSPAPTTFTVGGKTYTLSMSFLDAAGNPVTEFITLEGGLVNTANLDGQFTLVPPVLEVTKSGPATLTVGQSGLFSIDVRNSGPNDAWNTTLRDVLPSGPTGGMCDTPPQVLSARVFAADGVTPVPGKGPLVAGSDFTLSWAGAPSCELSLAMLTPAGAIDTDERLIVTYQSRLDANSQDGAVLTNVAGATEWFDDEISNPARVAYTRTLTNGTPGVLDHEDAHAITVDLQSYLFEKTVRNVTTGMSPATQAAPGDRLRYQLRIQNTGAAPLDDLVLRDELDRLNAPPVFAPGTLTVVTLPAGADASNTMPTGGAAGTGVVDVRNLSLAPGAVAVVEFEVVLAPVIVNGRYATNQSQLESGGAPFASSDDPNVNGAADPFVAGDEDPTRVLIQSAPRFRVEKISADLNGAPLLAGETLRYTITVKNVGSADAIDAALRDAIPASAQYVPGSTTLNGAAVPDAAGGAAPLSQGIPLHSPQDPTPGAMPADASASTANVATLSFDVVVDAAAVNGTIISNQAFVSALQGGVSDAPSDDPRTAIPDDPTRDVVGSVPLLFAPKRAALKVDAGTPGIVDPGDVLHYTIEVQNTGAVPATGAVLTDQVPASTTYVADSTTLNGLAVGRPDGGVAPLVSGIPISSADLTPPLPGAGQGTISPGQSALLEFDLQVNAGVQAGTLITNQALVTTNELPGLPTDGDGNPATGPEPTVVVVGAGQQLTIAKWVAVVGGGPALAGSQLEYLVQVRNIAAVPAYGVVITDDLAGATPGSLAYLAGSATLNGALTGVSFAGSVLTADYSTSYGPLAPGASVVLRFRATLGAGLAMGTRVTNVGVVTWNTTQTASASVSIDVGGMPGVGVLAGAAWHDANFDAVQDASERPLQGWSVELTRNGLPVQSVLTDASGTYRIAGVAPNAATADRYMLRFRAPGAGAATASLGTADSVYTNGPQQISDIVVMSGANLQGLNLPITPNGVAYDALLRAPIAGATLTLMNAGAGAPLPAACFDDAAQQGQVTLGEGFYKFDLNFSDTACPSGGSYVIAVAASGGFSAGYSLIIPPISTPAAPLSVPMCPGSPADAVLATAQHCESQPSELAPPQSVPARSAGTNYSVHLVLDDTNAPGSSQIFNNHLPLDPVLTGAVTLTKSTPSVNVSRGQLVPYEIVVANQLGAPIPDLSLADRFPAGFQYVEGSARLDGVPSEPTRNGRELLWANVGIGSATQRTLALLLAVGAGVSEGEFVNRAQALSGLTGLVLSPEATARVRVVPDPTFDCTDVLGKVFDDADRDGVQARG